MIWKWIKSWVVKPVPKVPPLITDVVNPILIEALHYSKKKLDADPSSRRMTVDQKEKEILEWAIHYLREKKRIR